jgi:hypothetical protein
VKKRPKLLKHVVYWVIISKGMKCKCVTYEMQRVLETKLLEWNWKCNKRLQESNHSVISHQSINKSEYMVLLKWARVNVQQHACQSWGPIRTDRNRSGFTLTFTRASHPVFILKICVHFTLVITGAHTSFSTFPTYSLASTEREWSDRCSSPLLKHHYCSQCHRRTSYELSQ